MNRNILNDEELLELLYNTNWSDSEDGLDVSDNEQDHHVINIHENVGIPTYDNDEGKITILITIHNLYFYHTKNYIR